LHRILHPRLRRAAACCPCGWRSASLLRRVHHVLDVELETHALLEDGIWLSALTNVIVSVALSTTSVAVVYAVMQRRQPADRVIGARLAGDDASLQSDTYRVRRLPEVR
jgi:hypothetical protein